MRISDPKPQQINKLLVFRVWHSYHLAAGPFAFAQRSRGKLVAEHHVCSHESAMEFC